MKKLFLILFLGIIVASCGGGETAKPTEIVSGPSLPLGVAEEVATETATTEEFAQTEITEITEITYFDDVFNCTDCRGYLFLAKDMTWYDLSGGSSLFLSYGTYSISNGVVTLSTEYSDSGQYGNRMYNITYKDSELFLIDEDMEYKIDYKANKEELFGSAINLRQKNENTNRGDNYSWIDGKWNTVVVYDDNCAIYGELHINYSDKTIKVYLAEMKGMMTVARGLQYDLVYNGGFYIDGGVIKCGYGGSFRIDEEGRYIYNGNARYSRGSKMNNNNSWF